MRIVKHGDGLLYREQEHTCTQCQCVFRYVLADVENYMNYDQEKETFISKIFVKCPECHLAYFIEPVSHDEPTNNDPGTLEPVDPEDVNPDPEPTDPDPIDPEPEPVDPEPIGGD